MILETTTNTSLVEPLTYASIYKTLMEFKHKYADTPKKVKVAPDVYYKIIDMEIEEQRKRADEGVESMPPQLTTWQTFYGLPIEIDFTFLRDRIEIVR